MGKEEHQKRRWLLKDKVGEAKARLRQAFHKDKMKLFFTDLFFLLIACALGAYSVVAVLVPNGLTSGGLTGIVRILQRFIPLDFSIMFYGGSMIILLLVCLSMGFKEARKIALLAVLFPTVLFIFEQMPLLLLEEKDLILAAIFCGVFSGACSGIIFWRGYSFCGTDAIAKIIRKKWLPSVALSQILLFIDGAIIIGSAAIYGRNIALYALVTQVIFAKTVDYVMYGFETKIVKLEIITRHSAEITEYIMRQIDRGVTEVNVIGGYTKTTHKQLVTLCSPRESVLIKKFIAKTDKNAFVTVSHVGTVWGAGEGFRDIDVD